MESGFSTTIKRGIVPETDSSFVQTYILETIEILKALDITAVEACVAELAQVRDQGGRVFVLGVGGSAATASHVVNDLRKIARIEAYAPTDNVAELTARTNDDGWETTLAGWLDTSRLCARDALLVFSVGGGSSDTSSNIVAALNLAVEVDANIVGIVGRSGGHTAGVAKACLVIPPQIPQRVTAHTEGVAMVIHHLMVSHPKLSR